MPLGFLAVTSNPSQQITVEEFHAWYEEEHIPLRLNHLKEFLSGARYHLVSTSESSESSHATVGKPTWLAMYEIDDTSTFAKPAYTNLREQRSEREKGVMSRLDVLVRVTGEVVGVWPGHLDVTAVQGESTGMKPGRPSQWVVTHGMNGDDGVVKGWAERIHGSAESRIRGWVKTSVVRVLDSGVSRFGAPVKGGDPEEVAMPYLVVHEFNDLERAQTFMTRAGEGGPEIENCRWSIWELHKAYPCLAQGNVVF